MSGPPPVITFLSDYGLADEYVGVCHGVIARRCPPARVIDITHGIPRGDVRAGAIILRGALGYVPAGVHLAVVDPGVGSSRAAVALRAGAQGDPPSVLVGPDNGLLIPAAERLGGVREAVEISGSRERLEPVSSTFHGRDLFAPVAAALAAGEELRALGETLDPVQLQTLALPVARLDEHGLATHVVHRDRFGNLILDADEKQLESLGVVPGATVTIGLPDRRRRRSVAARYCSTFGEVEHGDLLVYVDGLGMVALAVNGGSAEELLGLERDDELTLAPA